MEGKPGGTKIHPFTHFIETDFDLERMLIEKQGCQLYYQFNFSSVTLCEKTKFDSMACK